MWNFKLKRDKRLPEWIDSLPFEAIDKPYIL